MLEKNDLKAIKEIVNERAEKTEAYLKDYVGFEIEKSEMRLETKFGKKFDELRTKIKETNRNINDMIKTDREFLEILGKHENRIQKLETVVEKC